MEIPTDLQTLHAALINKKYSAVELVDQYIQRINAFDSNINSILTLTDELAYAQAKKVDRIIAELGAEALKSYPLLGAVLGYKDMFLKEGVRTTAGSKVLADYKAQYTATAIKRMEDAGAITLAKLNQDAWAHGASGENTDFEVTRNPFDRSYVTGGSSSGSAAAVAARFSLFALGTDTGGSVRQPASFTNLVGLKPTYGAISRYGVIAMASSLDTVGIFGQSAQDVNTVFDALKGPDGYDSNACQGEVKKLPDKLKIGLPKEYFGAGLDAEVKTIVEEAAELYQNMGHELMEISLPHTSYGIAVYYIIQPAEVSSNLARYDGVRYGQDRSAFSAEAKRRIMLGSYVLSAGYYDAYYLKAMKVRSIIAAEIKAALDKVDFILTPVAPTPAFKIGEKVQDPLKMYLSDIFTVTANLVGIPALAIPAGFTQKGLPVGFQLMGPRFSETTLLNLAAKYQDQTSWHTRKAIL